jgi:hypothetical protein
LDANLSACADGFAQRRDRIFHSLQRMTFAVASVS